MLNKLPANSQFFSAYLPALIAAVYLLVAIASVQFDSVTYDESAHLRYGIQILKGSPDRTTNIRFRSTMPVSVLNALPRAAEQVMHPGTKKTDWGKSDVKQGRYITIFCTLLLLFYCYRFAVSVASAQAACLVMILIAFDPNIMAHSRLVTTDVYAVISFIATLYHLWQWLVKKEQRHFYYWCMAIAVAQCCKPNNILLYPVCLLPVFIYSYSNIRSVHLCRVLAGMAIFAGIQLLVINMFFLFAAPWGYTLASVHFSSHFFKTLQGGWLAKIPVPFPKAYVDTYDLVQYERETFDGTALNYLAGELRYKKGFWNYYLSCYMLKTPFLTILLTAAASFYALAIKKIRRQFILFCCLPSIFILVFLSRSSIQNGYRYLLPLTCLAVIFSSWILQFSLQKKTGITVLCVSMVALLTVALSFPNYIAYTNPLVTDKKMAYRYFADSNLNWGQRYERLQPWMSAHPGSIFEPPGPVTGLIVVDLNNLVGLSRPSQFAWLREHYLPTGTIDDCYLVYEVKQLPAGYR